MEASICVQEKVQTCSTRFSYGPFLTKNVGKIMEIWIWQCSKFCQFRFIFGHLFPYQYSPSLARTLYTIYNVLFLLFATSLVFVIWRPEMRLAIRFFFLHLQFRSPRCPSGYPRLLLALVLAFDSHCGEI